MFVKCGGGVAEREDRQREVGWPPTGRAVTIIQG